MLEIEIKWKIAIRFLEIDKKKNRIGLQKIRE